MPPPRLPNGGGFPCPVRFEGGLGAMFADAVKQIPFAFIDVLRVASVTAGTPTQVSIDHILCDGVLVTADDGNTGLLVVIGSQSVRAATDNMRGIPVISANPPVWIPINDLFKLWIDVRTGGDGVSLAYFRY